MSQYSKLLAALSPYRKGIVLVMLLVLSNSLAQLYLPSLMSDIVDTGIVQGNTAFIIKIGAWMLLVAAGGAVCAIVAGYLSAKVATGYARDVRSQVFSHVESYSLQDFDTLGTASLITRTTNDITQLQQFLIMTLRMMLTAPLMCVGGIIMAVLQDAKLSLLLMVAVPLLAVIIVVVSQKALPLFKAIQAKLDKLNLVLRERLTGIRVIRAFNRTAYEKERFVAANSDLTDTSIRVSQLMAILMPVLILIMDYTTIAVIWFGSLRIEAGEMQVGSLMAFIQYVMQIMFSLMMLSMMFVLIPRASASAVRINQVLNKESFINDPEQPLEDAITRGHVEFIDVTYSFPGAEKPALQNISFTARPGEMTAIIGSTGAGKTTLLNLIPRFFDIGSGQIRIDGTDIRKITQKDLRAQIGYVPQKALLFTGTIAENIRFGKKDAVDEEVIQAAQTAQAEEFITGMEDGYDSILAQGGLNLSGGQKQRLSIARALVRKPLIYLFDDSFSALDFKTDARLRAALKKDIAEATVIVVAQRVNTVVNADKIIVMDEGEIVDSGTHQELLKSCRVYQEIVSSQLAEEETA